MSERKSLLADNAMSTLETLMEFIGMDPESENIPDIAKNNLERLINGASSYIETMTDRKFSRQRYVENLYGSGSQEICLKQYPIVSVDYIMDKESGETINPDSYSFSDTGRIGVVYRDQGWADKAYLGGLSYDPVASKRYLKVAYEAGYILPKDATEDQPSDLPYDLQYIIWQMVQQQWNLANNGANGLSSFSISDVSWTFDKELSSQVKDVINSYQRWE